MTTFMIPILFALGALALMGAALHFSRYKRRPDSGCGGGGENSCCGRHPVSLKCARRE